MFIGSDRKECGAVKRSGYSGMQRLKFIPLSLTAPEVRGVIDSYK